MSKETKNIHGLDFTRLDAFWWIHQLSSNTYIWYDESDGRWWLSDVGGYDTVALTPAEEKVLFEWLKVRNS